MGLAIMKPSLPTLLSFNGGYVDTAGYIALQGLFTAHVTGNFVTIGSALVFGSSGVIAKLLALPVFCAVIIITRLAVILLSRERSTLRTVLSVKLLLLMLGAYFAIRGLSPDTRIATLSRLRRMGIAVIAIAVGAAAAALFISRLGNWCFVVPPIVALAACIAANSFHAVPPAQPATAPSGPAS